MSASSDLVRLEPLAAAHLEQTWRWLQDPALRAAIDSLAAPSLEGNARYWESRLTDPHRSDFAVLAGDEHVGNCGLLRDDPRSKAELWLYLGTSRRAGIGRRAIRLLLTHGFGELGLERISLRVLSTNASAVAFWRELGFVDEGCWRRDTVVDGTRADSLWLGMLREEWDATS